MDGGFRKMLVGVGLFSFPPRPPTTVTFSSVHDDAPKRPCCSSNLHPLAQRALRLRRVLQHMSAPPPPPAS
ncbi:hypothetical protein GUJ93_ZPchr0004g40505 [Zizania palustris]|uniref:Uncharacterized protein n=1 Tax=Zizania palustris TaxID=103762 RepID=A0A8J5SXP4_ZIZPA|nr:hypothetical protein GUJ93_ZPchr0004g40505 [Zizania palustris]